LETDLSVCSLQQHHHLYVKGLDTSHELPFYSLVMSKNNWSEQNRLGAAPLQCCCLVMLFRHSHAVTLLLTHFTPSSHTAQHSTALQAKVACPLSAVSLQREKNSNLRRAPTPSTCTSSHYYHSCYYLYKLKYPRYFVTFMSDRVLTD
jgi:hypothetical protein